jgi:hypothetical protein
LDNYLYRKDLEHYVRKYLVEHPGISSSEVTEEHVYDTLKVCALPLRKGLSLTVSSMVLDNLSERY